MTPRFGAPATAAMLLSIGLALSAFPVAAQPPSKTVAYGHKHFQHSCRPPLKFAAGACVRHCPGGYQDNGRYCRFRSKHN